MAPWKHNSSGLFVAPSCYLLHRPGPKSITDELAGRVKRDPGPEDLLSGAKNCLDLLMRPDKEPCPGRATLAPQRCREGRITKKEGEKQKEERKSASPGLCAEPLSQRSTR